MKIQTLSARLVFHLLAATLIVTAGVGCGTGKSSPGSGSGGAAGVSAHSGGSGPASGGAGGLGTGVGGAPGSGGASAGGSGVDGGASGGAAGANTGGHGGVGSGGTSMGGRGGTSTGGSGTGGTASGGRGGSGTGGTASGGRGGSGTGGTGIGGRGGAGGNIVEPGVSYSACTFGGGIVRFVIAKRDTQRNLCVVLVLDSPGTNPFSVVLPPIWGVEFAFATPALPSCLVRFPPSGSTAATAATGTVNLPATPQPTATFDVTLSFPPGDAGVGPTERLMGGPIIAPLNCP